MRLKWTESGVQINPELKLLQYNLGTPLEFAESDGFMPEKEGNFSRLTVYFRFERQIGHHLIQTYAPSALVVQLSWFSFWLGLDAIPGRVTLLVTCMLTLVTMFTGASPPVAYVKVNGEYKCSLLSWNEYQMNSRICPCLKALDVWMAGCMMFVFGALAEFVVVKWMHAQYNNQLSKFGKLNHQVVSRNDLLVITNADSFYLSLNSNE